MDKWDRTFRISLLIAVFMTGILIGHAMHEKQHSDEISAVSVEINRIKEHQKQLESVIELAEEYQTIILDLQEDNRKLRETLDRFDIQVMEVTGYAPLDPNAIEGMCYEGDPSITASGERFIPGYTAAAPKNIPFGTKIYVEGMGEYEVQDRGGMITDGKIDLGFERQSEALEFGRKQKVVVYEIK